MSRREKIEDFLIRSIEGLKGEMEYQGYDTANSEAVVIKIPLGDDLISKEEALATLKSMTGQDFGDDVSRWRKWFEENPSWRTNLNQS